MSYDICPRLRLLSAKAWAFLYLSYYIYPKLEACIPNLRIENLVLLSRTHILLSGTYVLLSGTYILLSRIELFLKY